MDKEFNIDFGFNKQYPNAVRKNTSDSETTIKMRDTEIKLKTYGGIAFYCNKRHEYIYIK